MTRRGSSPGVLAAISALRHFEEGNFRRQWLRAVCGLASKLNPSHAEFFAEFLDIPPSTDESLVNLSIGEIGVVYEACTAFLSQDARRSQGQFFTPDDAASFMAKQSESFPSGATWLDPCCGVGNLSWHLCSAQEDPTAFVRDRLSLGDLDEVALLTAAVLLAAKFGGSAADDVLIELWKRCYVGDYLASPSPSSAKYVIANPPYARTNPRPGLETSQTRDLFAFFLERIVRTSLGAIVVTPASYLSSPRYAPVRDVLNDACDGGDVFVFDNVPDTLFRGFKYGSKNTSNTNFVRAAITVVKPSASVWRITPILRWTSRSRAELFAKADSFLADLRIGPEGEWAKLMPATTPLWFELDTGIRLADLLSKQETPFRLEVASTPRYYISATRRVLDRTSKHVLFFNTAEDRDVAYLLLNSALPYWWWRTLDGGVTLPMRVLRSLPVPEIAHNQALIERLLAGEVDDLVVKINAGRVNENVKRPIGLVQEVTRAVIPGFRWLFDEVFSSDLFSA